MSRKLLTNKVIAIAILIVGAVSAVIAVSSIAQATAQQEREKMMMWAGGMPEIKGSVSVANEASNFINENVRVSFVSAAETAQNQVADGKVLAGRLGVVQGYLVYTFFVANTSNQTVHLTLIDAGNGAALYASDDQPMGSFGHSMYGAWDAHGYGGWRGPWNGHSWWETWR
jgi:uncharacterized membrane protein YkoI